MKTRTGRITSPINDKNVAKNGVGSSSSSSTKANSKKKNQKKSNITNTGIDIGKRVEVYWSSDETYYPGKVVHRIAKKRGRQRSTLQQDTTPDLRGSRNAHEKLQKKNHASRRRSPRKNYANYNEDSGNDDPPNPHEFDYLIEYDDGEKGWIDLSNTNVKVMNKSGCEKKQEQSQKMKTIVEQLPLHSSLLIWWPQEKKYFKGILDEINIHRTGECNPFENYEDGDTISYKPHHIRYDDGDEEWTNLLHRDFKIDKRGPSKVKEEMKSGTQGEQKKKRKQHQQSKQFRQSRQQEKSQNYRPPTKRQKIEKKIEPKNMVSSSSLPPPTTAETQTFSNKQKTGSRNGMKFDSSSNSDKGMTMANDVEKNDAICGTDVSSKIHLTSSGGYEKSQIQNEYKHHNNISDIKNSNIRKANPQCNVKEEVKEEDADHIGRGNTLKDACIIS